MKRDIIRRSGLTSIIAVFILLSAVLPNLSYLGHPQSEPSHIHASGQSSAPGGSPGEEHKLHCHTGPAGCAGAQAMVGAIWVGEDSKLITPPSETRKTPDSSQPTTPEAPVFQILEPPRFA